jgi:hypothetical protein
VPSIELTTIHFWVPVGICYLLVGAYMLVAPVGLCRHAGGSCWFVPTCWWFLSVGVYVLVVPVGRCLHAGGSCRSVSTCSCHLGVYVLMPSRCLRVGASILVITSVNGLVCSCVAVYKKIKLLYCFVQLCFIVLIHLLHCTDPHDVLSFAAIVV